MDLSPQHFPQAVDFTPRERRGLVAVVCSELYNTTTSITEIDRYNDEKISAAVVSYLAADAPGRDLREYHERLSQELLTAYINRVVENYYQVQSSAAPHELLPQIDQAIKSRIKPHVFVQREAWIKEKIAAASELEKNKRTLASPSVSTQKKEGPASLVAGMALTAGMLSAIAGGVGVVIRDAENPTMGASEIDPSDMVQRVAKTQPVARPAIPASHAVAPASKAPSDEWIIDLDSGFNGPVSSTPEVRNVVQTPAVSPVGGFVDLTKKGLFEIRLADDPVTHKPVLDELRPVDGVWPAAFKGSCNKGFYADAKPNEVVAINCTPAGEKPFILSIPRASTNPKDPGWQAIQLVKRDK